MIAWSQSKNISSRKIWIGKRIKVMLMVYLKRKAMNLLDIYRSEKLIGEYPKVNWLILFSNSITVIIMLPKP
ncbi:hypothetical protein D3C80_1191780 [compost metagenome]